MKRTLTLVTALLASLVSLHAAVTKPESPNIILRMTDDQGWGDVSYNGLTKIKTPNIDAMAAAGIRFNRRCWIRRPGRPCRRSENRRH